MKLRLVFFELRLKFDICRAIKLENGGGVGNRAVGGIISKCTVRWGGFRVAGGGQPGCLSIAALSHSRGEFSEAHCASGPRDPP